MKELFQASLNFNGGILEPSDIITFNQKYKNNINELMIIIKKAQKTREFIRLFFKRITPHGYKIDEKVVLVKSIRNNGFYYLPKGYILSEGEPAPFIRWDNVLGEVPILPKYKDCSIFTTSPNFPNIKNFFEYKVCTPLKKFEGIDCTIYLYFQYGKGTTFHEYEFCSMGHFKKANFSNVEYFHLYTYAKKNSIKYEYVNYVPGYEIDRFIAPDRILTRINLREGLLQINPYDDN